MTPEDGPVEVAPDPFGLLFPDGLGPCLDEVVDPTDTTRTRSAKSAADPTAANLKSPW